MAGATAALSAVPRLYAANAVPLKPTYPYGSFAASFGRPGEYATLDVRHQMRWGRVVVQCFGRTVDSVTDLMNQVVDALLDQRLSIAGWRDETPCGIELDPTTPTRDPDDAGVLTSTATLTFTAIKEA